VQFRHTTLRCFSYDTNRSVLKCDLADRFAQRSRLLGLLAATLLTSTVASRASADEVTRWNQIATVRRRFSGIRINDGREARLSRRCRTHGWIAHGRHRCTQIRIQGNGDPRSVLASSQHSARESVDRSPTPSD
jgi:hypothetical protein